MRPLSSATSYDDNLALKNRAYHAKVRVNFRQMLVVEAVERETPLNLSHETLYKNTDANIRSVLVCIEHRKWMVETASLSSNDYH